MGRLTIEQAIEYWKIFLDEIEELRATPEIDPEEWDEQEKATVAALEALVKQRHYEDLEEQGKLIELPCAVGDKVWMVVDNREFKEHMKGCYPPAEELPDLYISEHDFSLLHLPSMGKRVFLTKEEAEAKLKELEG